MTHVVDGIEAAGKLAGTELGPTGWLEITQERVNLFADATDDHQWIHLDVEKAKQGPFKTTIAHGFLTLSLVVPLAKQLIEYRGTSMGVNYGVNKVRFPAPVPVGTRIRAVGKVASAEQVTGGVQVTLDITIEAEGSAKPVCVAQTVSRIYA